MPQPLIPIHVIIPVSVRTGGGIDFLVFVEQTHSRIAIVAGVSPSDFSNPPVGNGRPTLPVGIIGSAIRSDLKNLLVPTHRITYLDRLFNGVGHRFLAVDVFPGLHRFNADLRVPVIRSGNQDRIDILTFQQSSVVSVALPVTDSLGAVETPLVDIADRDDFDIFGL